MTDNEHGGVDAARLDATIIVNLEASGKHPRAPDHHMQAASKFNVSQSAV